MRKNILEMKDFPLMAKNCLMSDKKFDILYELYSIIILNMIANIRKVKIVIIEAK